MYYEIFIKTSKCFPPQYPPDYSGSWCATILTFCGYLAKKVGLSCPEAHLLLGAGRG